MVCRSGIRERSEGDASQKDISSLHGALLCEGSTSCQALKAETAQKRLSRPLSDARRRRFKTGRRGHVDDFAL
jgi:hypothetical protein